VLNKHGGDAVMMMVFAASITRHNGVSALATLPMMALARSALAALA